jgi:hypothetical protein
MKMIGSDTAILMMKSIVLFCICVLPVNNVIAQVGKREDTKINNTCSKQNIHCTAFCKSSGRGESCTQDCGVKQTSCLQTGEYFWRDIGMIKGLRRQ